MQDKNEPSPTMHDPNTQSSQDYTYRNRLADYIANSKGSDVEKFENFAKYTPRQNLARFLARYEIFKMVQDVQGSIVECGVLFGGGLMSFANLSAILEPYNFQRRVIGFDTFEGFPEIASQDLEGLAEKKSAHLKEGGFSVPDAYDDLQQAISVFDQNRFLNHFPKVEIIKGDFEATSVEFLKNNPHLIISCLYLDFDIYKPTKLAIDHFLDRMPKGSVLVFDELNEEAFPGETIAVLDTIGVRNLRIQRFSFEPRISYAILD